MPSPHQPPDEPWSAPESGTVRDPTSGNGPSDRGNSPGKPYPKSGRHRPGPDDPRRDDPSEAGEEP